MTLNYGFGKVVAAPFEQVLTRVVEELQKEGFGVLTEIDVAATLKKKLGKDTQPYRILGACNPALAYQAISAEPSIGLLLPCNVVVRQDDQQRVHVEFMDPEAVMNLVGRAQIKPLASEVRDKLQRVLQAL
jgi:uncharacterized protein (DUF302 family)